MSIQDMSAADLAAVVNDNDGFGGNGNGWWIILLFLFLGWGNNGWGGNGNNGAAGAEAWSVYPLLENQQNLFTGFGNIQNSLCAGFANAETAATARQMSDMQQMFGIQTSMLQGFNAQQAQLAQCCCDNRLATAEQTATILAENCADRQAISDGVRDILANQTAGIQMILDKMCQTELAEERRTNELLRQQIAMANLAASQTAQTSQIIDALKTTTTAGA